MEKGIREIVDVYHVCLCVGKLLERTVYNASQDFVALSRVTEHLPSAKRIDFLRKREAESSKIFQAHVFLTQNVVPLTCTLWAVFSFKLF